MEDLYTPTPPDLEKLNMSLVEWMEEAVSNHPDGDYLAPDRDRPGSEEEEDEHWTALARSLSEEEVEVLEKRIWHLRSVSSQLNQIRKRTLPNYLTQSETREYIERRSKEGFNSWDAKREIREGRIVPPADS